MWLNLSLVFLTFMKEISFFENGCYSQSWPNFSYGQYFYQGSVHVIDQIYANVLNTLWGRPHDLNSYALCTQWKDAEETIEGFTGFNVIADAASFTSSNMAKGRYRAIRARIYVQDFIDIQCRDFYTDQRARYMCFVALMRYNDWLEKLVEEYGLDVHVGFTSTMKMEHGVSRRKPPCDEDCSRLRNELYRLAITLAEIFYQLQERMLGLSPSKMTAEKETPKRDSEKTERLKPGNRV